MRIAICSTMIGQPWGGSEELWSRAAAVLLQRGHAVSVNYRRRTAPVPAIERLQALGLQVHWRRRAAIGRTLRGILDAARLAPRPSARWLKSFRPDFVLLSMGHHLDDVSIAQTCRSLAIPYGILVQSASPYQWIDPSRFETHRAAFAGAIQCYFVSAQNREVLESNLALDLSGSQIVDNPFQVRADVAPTWPANDRVWKLACVARIMFQSKAQDLLLRIMGKPRWRARPVQVVLWGADGGSLRQVEKLVAMHTLQRQVLIGGVASDIERLWSEHHALVLPSRYEGNALAMIEAMLCGRLPIVTNVGRVAELVDDNCHGFVAPAATAELFDDALERAWQRRHEWQAMGALAAKAIRVRHSLRPAEDFADALLAAATGRKQTALRAAA